MSAAFTPEQIKYLQDHIDETRVPSIHISNGICIGAATIAVVLRSFARRLGKTGLGKDDYCLFLAYVSLSSSISNDCPCAKHGIACLDLVRMLRCGIQCHDPVWDRSTCDSCYQL